MVSSYPPPGQILSVLGIELMWVSEDRLSGAASVDPELLGLDGASPGVAALVPLVDIMAGTLAGKAFSPDWQTTTDVWVHEIQPLEASPITMDMATLRLGKRNLVVRADVYGGGQPVATSTIEFTRISRSASPHTLKNGPSIGESFTIGSGPLLDQGLHDACEFTVVEPGVVELEKSEFVRNSMGTLQGGAAALLAEVAAVSAARTETRPVPRVVDLHYRFLGQTREGPARATATTLRDGNAGATVSVEIVDRSQDDAIVGWAVASVV